MSNTREKLIELIAEEGFSTYYKLADHLIANGVTIPVRCGECIHRVRDNWSKCIGRRPHEFCSDGKRRTYNGNRRD